MITKEDAANVGVLILGDCMVDKYIIGTAKRIAQEAPVPVISVETIKNSPGGAANVASNVKALRASPVLLGCTGKSNDGLWLKNEHSRDSFFVDDGVTFEPTVKTRIYSDHHMVARYDIDQVIYDKEVYSKLYAATIKRLKGGLIVFGKNALILEDYNKGVLRNHDMVQRVLHFASNNGIVTALDPHPSNKMIVSPVNILTPNLKEAMEMTGASNDDKFDDIADDLIKRFGSTVCLITLGSLGIHVKERDKAGYRVEAKAADVYDVTGAGDTVVAAFVVAYSVLGREKVREAAEFANAAASVVVGKAGTSVATLEEVEEKLSATT